MQYHSALYIVQGKSSFLPPLKSQSTISHVNWSEISRSARCLEFCFKKIYIFPNLFSTLSLTDILNQTKEQSFVQMYLVLIFLNTKISLSLIHIFSQPWQPKFAFHTVYESREVHRNRKIRRDKPWGENSYYRIQYFITQYFSQCDILF